MGIDGASLGFDIDHIQALSPSFSFSSLPHKKKSETRKMQLRSVALMLTGVVVACVLHQGNCVWPSGDCRKLWGKECATTSGCKLGGPHSQCMFVKQELNIHLKSWQELPAADCNKLWGKTCKDTKGCNWYGGIGLCTFQTIG